VFVLDAAREIVTFATVAVFVLSVIAALALRPKYLELICHFRVQYTIGAVVLGLVCVAIAEWAGAAISLTSVFLNFPVVALRGRSPRSPEISGRRFKLMLMNVYRLNRRYDLCVDRIRKHQPDVVIVQEVDEEWARELECLRGDYPFADVQPLSDGSGIALYSCVAFDPLPAALPEDRARPGILAKLWGGELTILSIHPRAPIRRGHFELRNRMLSAGAAVIREISGPKICVGDLNTTMWSRYFKDFVGQSGLRNVRDGFGVLATWPTFMGAKWMMIPIDHCLVSNDISVVSATVGEHIGSDHLPLIVELELRRDRAWVSTR
jgi:endonuclease/exonuclease/phosphatase (EEP) superfamily protein YafD